MVSIDGGSEFQGVASTLSPAAPGSSEERLTAALRRCVARWGFAKTTVEDIAREAGMSRATAYRVFPGGKSEMFSVATFADAARLAEETSVVVAAAEDLHACLAGALHHAATFLEAHDAFRFLREHEPVLLEQHLGFDGADALLVAAGSHLGTALERFFAPGDAREVGTWLARIVLSYTQSPSPTLDLTRRTDVDDFVASFLLPGMPPVRSSDPAHPADQDPDPTR